MKHDWVSVAQIYRTAASMNPGETDFLKALALVLVPFVQQALARPPSEASITVQA
jgi:hypothetical protein